MYCLEGTRGLTAIAQDECDNTPISVENDGQDVISLESLSNKSTDVIKRATAPVNTKFTTNLDSDLSGLDPNIDINSISNGENRTDKRRGDCRVEMNSNNNDVVLDKGDGSRTAALCPAGYVCPESTAEKPASKSTRVALLDPNNTDNNDKDLRCARGFIVYKEVSHSLEYDNGKAKDLLHLTYGDPNSHLQNEWKINLSTDPDKDEFDNRYINRNFNRVPRWSDPDSSKADGSRFLAIAITTNRNPVIFNSPIEDNSSLQYNQYTHRADICPPGRFCKRGLSVYPKLEASGSSPNLCPKGYYCPKWYSEYR